MEGNGNASGMNKSVFIVLGPFRMALFPELWDVRFLSSRNPETFLHCLIHFKIHSSTVSIKELSSPVKEGKRI
jgi:hypothetical protein